MQATIGLIRYLLILVIGVMSDPVWAKRNQHSEQFTFGVVAAQSANSDQGSEQQVNMTTHHAINTEYLHNIARALNMKFQLVAFNNIDDILNAIERKEIDGALGFARTSEREKRFIFSKPLFESTVAQWYRDAKLAQLPQSRLQWACVENSTSCQHILKHNPKSLKRYDNFPQAMQAVMDGEAQAIIEGFISISEYLDRHNITYGLLTIPKALPAEQLRLLTTADNQALVDKFNRVLEWEEKGLNVRSIASNNRYHIANKLINNYRQFFGDQHPITYSTGDSAYPFFYTDKQGSHHGFLLDFFALLKARTGLEFRYHSPITTHKGDLAGFTADLVPVAFSDKPVTGDWNITQPFLVQNYLSMEASSLLPHPKSGQVGVLVSVQKQGIVHLESWHNSNMQRFDDLSDMVEALREGDIDVAYVPEEVAHAFVANGGDNDILLGNKPPLTISLAFAVSKGNNQVLQLINALLDTIDSQEIEILSQRYRRFNLNYGFNTAELASIAVGVLLLFFAVIAFGYIGRNNLRLKVRLAQSVANQEEQEKYWLKEIIQEISNLIFIHDAQNHLVLSNCSKLRDGTCTGCQLKDSDTQQRLVHDAMELQRVFAGERLSQTHRTTGCALNIQHATRERKVISSSVSGKPYVITVMQDISAQKRREEHYLKAQHDAQAAVEARERFLATMSHELRTPIAGVHGLLELLQMKLHQPPLIAMVEQAQRSISHLNQLVDEILDFSKIDSGQISINATETDLLSTLCESVRSFESRAELKSLQYKVNIQPFAQRWVKIDGLRVTQIIANLLSNAIKFTSQGFVQFSAQVVDNCIELSVADSGIGMTEEQQQNVLKPFTQADDSITREFGGTGLGLTIVDKLVTGMAGQLNIKSEPNCGTTFSVILPFEAMTQPEACWDRALPFESLPHTVKTWLDFWHVPLTHAGDTGAANHAVPNHTVTNDTDANNSQQKVAAAITFSEQQQKYPDLLYKAVKNEQAPNEQSSVPLTKLSGLVLVAEDNVLNRSILAMQLRELGLDYVMVNDGLMATQLLQQRQDFQVLITDFHMPKMDGPQLAQYVRQHHHNTQLPIIAITADDKRIAQAKAKECGINLVLTKPYSLEQFSSALAPLLPDATPFPVWLTPFAPSEREQIAQLFIDTMSHDINNLNGDSDMRVKRSSLHNIKGGLAALQIQTLVENIRQIEALKGDDFTQALTQLVTELETEIQTTTSWIENND